jgi:hypothetical protein
MGIAWRNLIPIMMAGLSKPRSLGAPHAKIRRDFNASAPTFQLPRSNLQILTELRNTASLVRDIVFPKNKHFPNGHRAQAAVARKNEGRNIR